MRVSKYIIPLLVIVLLFGGYWMRFIFLNPTTEVIFNAKGKAKLECIVEGLKCKGTAITFTKLYENRKGIASIETYGSEYKAVFSYDPDLITPEKIIAIMEVEFLSRDGSLNQMFKCVSME